VKAAQKKVREYRLFAKTKKQKDTAMLEMVELVDAVQRNQCMNGPTTGSGGGRRYGSTNTINEEPSQCREPGRSPNNRPLADRRGIAAA
jgi:hypothetical protein